MIKEMHRTFTALSHSLGVPVRIPLPTREMLSASSALNFAVGGSLLAGGIIFSQKWCALAGGISIASGIVMRSEAKELTRK